MGVPRPNVARWEAGRARPNVVTAVDLATELETTVEAIWPPTHPRKRARAVAAAEPMTTSEVADAVPAP